MFKVSVVLGKTQSYESSHNQELHCPWFCGPGSHMLKNHLQFERVVRQEKCCNPSAEEDAILLLRNLVLNLDTIAPSNRPPASRGILSTQPRVQHGFLSARLTSVSSNFYEQQNLRQQSRGFQKRDFTRDRHSQSESTASFVTYNRRAYNICIHPRWQSGEKETLAGSWRSERTPQTSTTGTGQRGTSQAGHQRS